MKKLRIISIVALVLLVAAALIVAVCTDVKFDNPLDEKGTNFLKGDTSMRDLKLTPDEHGQAGLFTDTSLSCVMTDPALTMKGPQSVTIKSNETMEFLKWMGKTVGWTGVVDYEDGVDISAVLENASGVALAQQDVMPEPGSYFIAYIGTRQPCRGYTPRTRVPRGFNVELYVGPIDSTPPTITLLGRSAAEVEIGKVYEEQGVRISSNVGELPMAEALDSVLVLRTDVAGNTPSVIRRPVSLTDVASRIATTNERTYTITYYATAVPPGNGVRAVPVVRTVTVIKPGVVTTPKAVIVLNNYTYNINGVTAYLPDTAVLELRGTYVEKGVARAYYVKTEGGDTVAISTSLVVTIPPSNMSGLEAPQTRTVRYTLAAGEGYLAADDATRTVYGLYDLCEGLVAPPTIDGVAATVTLSAGGTWDGGSWSVGGRDVVDPAGRYAQPIKIGRGIDYGTLNPSRLNVGTHTVKYVAVSGCGMYAIKTSTVTVTP